MSAKLASLILLVALAAAPDGAGRRAIAQTSSEPGHVFAKADGYRGIWYANQPSSDKYAYKYSGGLGTYCAKHIPFAYYAREVDKTFFCYGGTNKSRSSLLEMVSYYDHKTGMVPRPTVLLDKKTADAHDNPTIMLDEAGHVWVFASSHGTARPSYVYKSTRRYCVDDFVLIKETNFSYPQPWYLAGRGFLFVHTKYTGGRQLFWTTSPDGRSWAEPQCLAAIAQGHYQISWRHGDKLGTAFNYHPQKGGLNWRTNLYYLATSDLGRTWRDVRGREMELPLRSVRNSALVRDYESEKLLVYLKDINFDASGQPIILYVTSRGYQAGPQNAPRTWTTAHWREGRWQIRPVTTSDNNYDTGCLHVEEDGTWRLIVPTDPGPQRYNPGGEMVVWISTDQGGTWRKLARLTDNSQYNHTYARRPVNAHPDFYAFWADGHGRQPSESRLYFADKAGRVWRLPPVMKGDFAKPVPVAETGKGR